MINNYNDLPIGKYLDILKVTQDDTLEEINKQVEVIAILDDKTAEEVLNLPITEYTQKASQTFFLSTAPQKAGRKVAQSYVLNGVKLIPTQNLNKITTAQYIDFQNYSKEADKHLIEIIGTFLIPEGKTYGEGYDVADVYKLVSNYLSIVDASLLSAFFLKQLRISIKATLIYFKIMMMFKKKKNRKEIMMRMKQIQIALQQIGVGLPTLI